VDIRRKRLDSCPVEILYQTNKDFMSNNYLSQKNARARAAELLEDYEQYVLVKKIKQRPGYVGIYQAQKQEQGQPPIEYRTDTLSLVGIGMSWWEAVENLRTNVDRAKRGKELKTFLDGLVALSDEEFAKFSVDGLAEDYKFLVEAEQERRQEQKEKGEVK
jgi:hypothetical protein